MFVVLAMILAAVFVLYSRWQGLRLGLGDLFETDNQALTPLEKIYLETYLSSRAKQLSDPAGSGVEPVIFMVSPGETADLIAANLAGANLLTDTQLFIRYVRYHGLDSKLEAGEFILDPRQSVPEIAAALTKSEAKDIELLFLEGWRYEEMIGYLADIDPVDIDPSGFRAIVRRQTTFDLSQHDFLASLPDNVTLEGFLFPDTYRVPADADAAYLVDLMLDNFGHRVTPAMRQSFGIQGLSLREAVTLASIVEREAVLPEERPIIASVFYNRLAQDMKLEADPTTQYALGYQADRDSWWKSPLTLEDLQFDSPYNTYLITGLPPGPIANPSLSSLQAVAEPAQTSFIFFVVDCTAAVSGTHDFSATYDEHLVKVQRCR